MRPEKPEKSEPWTASEWQQQLIFDWRYPINHRSAGGAANWGTRLSAVFGEAWRDMNVRFIIYWHGAQAPDPYIALRYSDWAFLNVTVPYPAGRATASFSGNVVSDNVSLSRCDNPLTPCHAGKQVFAGETHPYYVNFTRVREGLWKAELSVPFRARVDIQGCCPAPYLPFSSGYVEAFSGVGIAEPKFVYIVAENEPSYHKKSDCEQEMNNSSGRLDDRYGDTVIELHGEHQSVSFPGSLPYFYTDWYLGNRMRYARVLHGNWCLDDCPLNEWWICGAYYKDTLFHDFTSVNAIIGFPKSDCEDWYIGSESGWNDAPSAEFWQKEDVQERVRGIFSKLPYKYEVKLKVTDDYGNGFSDRANYTMIVHAPLENYTPIDSRYVYLPEQVGDSKRPHPTYFIPSPIWGATLIGAFENGSELEQVVTCTVTASDSYTLSTTISGECSASVGRSILNSLNIPLVNLQFGIKFGASKTVSTTTTYQIGQQITVRVPPRKKLFLYAQRAAVIVEGRWDAYGREGFLGTLLTEDFDRGSYFAWRWEMKDIDDR